MALNPVKCKSNEPFVERPLAGEFTWLVYNMRTNNIVAATHSSDMAAIILKGIQREPYMIDTYGITEIWKPTDSLI